MDAKEVGDLPIDGVNYFCRRPSSEERMNIRSSVTKIHKITVIGGYWV